MKCDICGREDAEWICVVCDNKMVCSDCDQKWHQHPKRQNHRREPLKPKFVDGMSSDLSSPGYFVRTSSSSEMPVKATVGAVMHENMNVAADRDSNSMPTAVNKSLTGEDSSHQDYMNVLPRSVAEINDDLAYQSLFGVNTSLTDECFLSEQIPHHIPDVDRGSVSRQFSSLTSDFQSMLESLQSKMDEVNSTISTSSSDFDDWSLPAAHKETVLHPSSSNHSKKPESSQSFVHDDRKQGGIDDDAELAMLLLQAKYPPNVGTPGSPIQPSAANMKPAVNEQAAAGKKLQNTGRSTHSETEIKDSVQRSGDKPTRSIPRNGMSIRSPVNPGNNFVQTGDDRIRRTVDRQRSQTSVKQRLTELPGVVFPRVGNGEDLGVLERPSGGSEPYHSKFTDIHDEV